ncbi:MAG: hypothetical protein JWN67_1764 [Actinomycetia bacterium]|nr:hypothetical protein [Actinomycetes bacterium]
MSYRAGYSEHDWQVLQFVPLAAYHAVGYADGSISPPETAQFLTKLHQVAGLDAPAAALVREVFESVRDDHERLLQRFDDARRGGMTFQLALADARGLLDRAEPAQAQSFRHVVRIVCNAVAGASPIVGQAVTAQEEAAIEQVCALLEPVPPAPAPPEVIE